MTETASVGLGRAGLGDVATGATPSSPARAVVVLGAAGVAFCNAMASNNFLLASYYLTFIQNWWNSASDDVKGWMAANGVNAAVVAALPNSLSVSGGLADGGKTHLVLVAGLGASIGPSSQSALAAMPATTADIGLWFQTRVAPLLAPSSDLWFLWSRTNAISTANAGTANDQIVSAATAYYTASPAAPPPPTVSPPPPDTNPGTGVAPVPTPTQLPTTPHVTLPPLTIMGSSGKVPTWVWVAAGGVALGAVVGVGYYVTKNRPDLFRSRRKKRRR